MTRFLYNNFLKMIFFLFIFISLLTSRQNETQPSKFSNFVQRADKALDKGIEKCCDLAENAAIKGKKLQKKAELKAKNLKNNTVTRAKNLKNNTVTRAKNLRNNAKTGAENFRNTATAKAKNLRNNIKAQAKITKEKTKEINDNFGK